MKYNKFTVSKEKLGCNFKKKLKEIFLFKIEKFLGLPYQANHIDDNHIMIFSKKKIHYAKFIWLLLY